MFSVHRTFIVVIALAGAAPVFGDFLLVSEGQPRAEIVLGEAETAAPVRFAAEELARYVQAMSGAEVPVVTRPTNGPGIHLRADAKLAGDGAMPERQDRYQIRINEKDIVITGATPRATLFGAYDLLERLGCSWCVPGDDTVPKRSTIALADLEIDTAPAFRLRKMVDFPLLTLAQSTAIIDWLAKNRMNWYHPAENAMGEPVKWYEWRKTLVPEIQKRGLNVNFGGHTMHTWIPPEEFKQHPDWFAYVDGERKAPALCVTNEEMTGVLVRNMQKFLDRCPEVDVIDVWHPDMDTCCHCPKCTKGLVPAEAKGKKPEAMPAASLRAAYVISYIEFMNRIGEGLEKSHPRILVSPLIYGPTDGAMPDGCPPMRDNMLLSVAHIARDTYRPLTGEPKSAVNMRYLGNDLTWMARSKHHYIYEYYNCWVEVFIYPGAQTIVRDLRTLRTVGAQGASSDMYGYSPCNMYVAARAMWSPDIDWEATVRDYYRRYFGEAAEPMADNRIKLERAIDGTNGYGSGGAHYPEANRRAGSGQVLHDARPAQIKFHEELIAKTSDPLVKARLERALLPWKEWGEKARWWALPDFGRAK